MKRRHRALMEELALAKPQVTQSPDEWTASEAEQLLARIHEQIERETQTAPVPKPRRSRRPLVIGAAAGVVAVAAVALLLSLWVVPGLTGRTQVVVGPSTSTTSSTVTVVTAAQTVTKEESLRALTELYQERVVVRPGQPSQGSLSVVELAQATGMVLGAEVTPTAVHEAATRGELALWIWRGWLRLLPDSAPSVAVADASDLTPEQAEAVRATAGLHVLELDAQGAFHPERSVTPAEQQRAMERLRTLLR
jgi:hypothetical protein